MKVWVCAGVLAGVLYLFMVAVLMHHYSYLMSPNSGIWQTIAKDRLSQKNRLSSPEDDENESVTFIYKEAGENEERLVFPVNEDVHPFNRSVFNRRLIEKLEIAKQKLEDDYSRPNSYGMTESREEIIDDIYLDIFVGKWTLLAKVNQRQVLSESMKDSDVKLMLRGGLYLLVLHQTRGDVMHSSRHRSFEVSGDDDLLFTLRNIQPGRIVILAAMHEGFHQLSDEVAEYLLQQGSRAIIDMDTGDRWAWIWTKDGRTWAEGAVYTTHGPSFQLQGGPLHIQVILPPAPQGASKCQNWPRDGVWKDRQEFCDHYEGYGSLCSCDHPQNLPIKEAPSETSDLPTVVVASQRPLCLHRCLGRLITVTGSAPASTLVVADGDPQGGLIEVEKLVSLYDMKFLGHDAGGDNVTLRISRHYRKVFEASFSVFPNAKGVIILEEDLYVSPDFYSYFRQTAPLLEQDPSLYCVSAWNDLSTVHTASDPSIVQRSETMSGLGWVLSRKIRDEVLPKWPPPEKHFDWDMWMRLPAQRRGRECLVPEVSRTYHFGATGAHLTAYFQSSYFSKTAFNTRPSVKLKDLNRVGPEEYDALLREMITRGKHLDGGAINPCNPSFVPSNSNVTHVLWMKMNEESDHYTITGVFKCLGLWDLDVRGCHKFVWRLRLRGTPFLLVGWPASPFSFLKQRIVSVLRRTEANGTEAEPPVYRYLNPST